MSQPKRTKNWSAEVTAHSDALDLEPDVFSMEDPSEIAELLKRSAELSDRRKSGAFRSAMSMLNLYINRAGRNLSPSSKTDARTSKNEIARAVWPQGLSLSPAAHSGTFTMSSRSQPPSDPAVSLPHGGAREKRQPYAAEHEDYTDGVARPPEEHGGTPRQQEKRAPKRR